MSVVGFLEIVVVVLVVSEQDRSVFHAVAVSKANTLICKWRRYLLSLRRSLWI